MIKQFVPKEACLKCQGCCRFKEINSVWSPCLLDLEIEKLLKKNIPPSVISSSKRVRLIPNSQQGNFVCALFNTQENICKIYSFRPFECQLYPFLINRKGKSVFLAVDLGCPFIKKILHSKEFRKYVQYLTEFINSPHQLCMLRNNPQIIQVYKGAENIFELKI